MKRETVFLVLTSAVVLAGEIRRAGSVVEVDNHLAADLLRRGRARVATESDAIPVVEQEQEPEQEQAADADQGETDPEQTVEQAPKKRGRPRKNHEPQPDEAPDA